MAKVRSKDTKPELLVRRLVHRLGYRFRLHGQKLPGRPDLVFGRRRKVIFVHGCFWHAHDDCSKARPPKSRQDYWLPKLGRNKARDAENVQALEHDGWQVLVIWGCELQDLIKVEQTIRAFLGDLSQLRSP